MFFVAATTFNNIVEDSQKYRKNNEINKFVISILLSNIQSNDTLFLAVNVVWEYGWWGVLKALSGCAHLVLKARF